MRPPFEITPLCVRLLTDIERLLGRYEGLHQPRPAPLLRKSLRVKTVQGPVNPVPVAYTSGFGTSKKQLKVSATFKVNDGWGFQGSTQVRAIVTDGYDIPQTMSTWSAGDSSSDTLTITSVLASKSFANGARYYPTFQLSWEINTGGAVWISIGATTNPLYLTWKNPANAPLYRTVVHIGSTNIESQLPVAIQTPNNVVGAVFNEFADNRVYKIDTTTALRYKHVTADPNMTTAELLQDEYGQCKGWSDFFNDTLLAQGAASGNNKSEIVAKGITVTGFIVNNYDFKAAKIFAELSASDQTYWQWKLDDNVRTTVSMDWQSGDVANEPTTQFRNHWVVVVNGHIYDPSYGKDFNSLAEWEAAAVAGVWKGDEGSPYIHKRVSGETLTRWALF